MKTILEKLENHDFEQLVYCHDSASGLKAIVAVHDTTLGPAMGGVRMKEYSNEDEALEDVMRLARIMTLKAAVSELDLGGGGAVILGNPKKDKNEALLRAFGRHIEGLAGRIFVGEDTGTTVEDIEIMSLETRFVSGLGKIYGGSGNPAIKAAFGVFRGIQAACEYVFGDPHLRGRAIAIQGIGSLGGELARLVFEDGGKLIIADKNPQKLEELVKKFNAQVVSPENILYENCDILAPCAMGGILNEKTIPNIKAKIIAGGANNQLADESHSELLYKQGIVYIPDFVINAGGLINAAEELAGYNEIRADLKINRIFNRVQEILQISNAQKISPFKAAEKKAMERINKLRAVRRTFLPA